MDFGQKEIPKRRTRYTRRNSEQSGKCASKSKWTLVLLNNNNHDLWGKERQHENTHHRVWIGRE